MPKKNTKKSVEVPYDGKLNTIYGIFNIKTKELIMVHLDINEVTFEFDIQMYDVEIYKIIKLLVKI
jgi:hypothetical protein